MGQTTQFQNLRRVLKAGGEVYVYRGACSIDVTLRLPECGEKTAASIAGSSIKLSDCLIEFERHLGGNPTARTTNHPIDSLPLHTGSDLKLTACGHKSLNLSVLGWSGQLRAEFNASTVEKVLDYADQCVGNPSKREKIYRN